MRAQCEQLAEHCDVVGRAPDEIARIYLAGNTDERPLASVTAFTDFAGRYRDLGFTDIVFHHPRPDDPAWADNPESSKPSPPKSSPPSGDQRRPTPTR